MGAAIGVGLMLFAAGLLVGVVGTVFLGWLLHVALRELERAQQWEESH